MIKQSIYLALCILLSQFSFAKESAKSKQDLKVDIESNSSGPILEILKLNKGVKKREKKNIIIEQEYDEVQKRDKNLSVKDITNHENDSVKHSEITSRNIRRLDGVNTEDTSSAQDLYRNSTKEKILDSARGPNSMSGNIMNNQHLNRIRVK